MTSISVFHFLWEFDVCDFSVCLDLNIIIKINKKLTYVKNLNELFQFVNLFLIFILVCMLFL